MKIDIVDGEYRVKVSDGEKTLPTILRRLGEKGVRVSKVSLIRPTLDQVFVEYTGREYREDETPVDTRTMTYIREKKR